METLWIRRMIMINPCSSVIFLHLKFNSFWCQTISRLPANWERFFVFSMCWNAFYVVEIQFQTNHSSFWAVLSDKSGWSNWCISNMPGTKWDGFWPSAIRVFCGSTFVVPQGDASFPTTVMSSFDSMCMRYDVCFAYLSNRDLCDSFVFDPQHQLDYVYKRKVRRQQCMH